MIAKFEFGVSEGGCNTHFQAKQRARRRYLLLPYYYTLCRSTY